MLRPWNYDLAEMRFSQVKTCIADGTPVKMVWVLVFCSLLIGCAIKVNHQVALESQISHIQIKQTNKDEVRRLFGPPHRFETLPDIWLTHETWSYWYDGRSLNSVNSMTPDLTVTFSRDGIVQSVSQHASTVE